MRIPVSNWFILFLVCFICSFSKINAQFLHCKTISTENGLPSNEVHSVIQDSKGYVWIGTKNGLCRWDSKNLEYFTIDDGLPNNEVLYLYEDSAGRIWISCFSQELCYFSEGRIYNRKNTPFLNKIKNYPGVAFIIKNEELYFKSIESKLHKFNLLTNSLTVYDTVREQAFNFISHKDKVWVIQEERNRNILDTSTSRNLIMCGDSSFYVPYHMFLNAAGSDILTRVDFKNKWYSFQHGFDAPFYKAFYKNHDFYKAVFTKNRIFEIYKNYIIEKVGNYRIKTNYPNRPQVFIVNKNLYIKETDGFLICRPIPILEYDHNMQLDNTSKFLFKYKGDPYIVNDKYQLINVKLQKQVNQLKDNPANLYSLLRYENTFYLTTSFRIYHFTDPNKAISDSKAMGIYNFKNISPSKKKNYFFAANGVRLGILSVNFQANTVKNLLVDTQKLVYSVLEDSRSRLWYSTTNKVYYTDAYYEEIKNSREFYLDTTRPLFCKSILEDNKENLFFVTNGGVFVYDGNKKYKIDKSNFLSDNECNKIIIDTLRSSFWVATKNGLNHIGYSKEGSGLKFKVLSKFFATDGLRSDNINDILLDSNKLYIATDKGVNILDNVNYAADTTNIAVYIKLQAVNAATGKSYDTIKTVDLRHDENNLTLGFSALYFLRRDRLKVKAYLYRNNRLVSQNEITGDKIDYYSLNDGDYKLVLYAYDQDYRYNNGRSEPFVFTIHPPYYKTWWFIVGSSLLVIIISTSLLLWNLNRRKKRAIQEAKLQAKLNESTLKSLQSQMNPHFVFNSLNTIQSFITEKNEEGAIDYLSDFSGLMREILEQSVHTFISLENEVRFLQHYIRLEMTRFKDSFDAVWNIELDEDDLTDIYIPTMLIQPILENAVKHGVSSLNDMKGHIEVTFDLINENLLRVVVKDNGRPVSGKKFKGNSIAVQTIKDRLNIYTKNKIKGKYHLQVSETGATATITIPI